MICPNKSLPEWKELVEKVGENKAYRIWNKEDASLSELMITKDSPEKSELQQLADKTKLFLQKKLAILEKKDIPNKKIKEAELKKIIDNIKALDEVSTINTFIEESYSSIKQAEYQFDKLISNKDNLSRHEIIEKLASFNDFANGYSILDEISKADIESYFNKPEKGLPEQGSFSTQDKLTYAISAREKIKQRYLKHGIPLLASWLLEEKSESLNKDAISKIVNNEKKILNIENDPSLRDKVKEIKVADCFGCTGKETRVLVSAYAEDNIFDVKEVDALWKSMCEDKNVSPILLSNKRIPDIMTNRHKQIFCLDDRKIIEYIKASDKVVGVKSWVTELARVLGK